MKKRFLFGLGLLLTSVVFAAGTSYFVNIDTKVEGDGLTASEFNQILHVLNGIQNDGGRIGIGKAPVSNVKLDVNGIIKVTPLATGGTCGSSIEGSIYLDSDDSNWYGCNGTDWVQLAGAEGGCTPDCEEKNVEIMDVEGIVDYVKQTKLVVLPDNVLRTVNHPIIQRDAMMEMFIGLILVDNKMQNGNKIAMDWDVKMQSVCCHQKIAGGIQLIIVI